MAAIPAVSAIEGPVEVATIAFVHKSAFDKYVDHVLPAGNVNLLKCSYKCYDSLLLMSSGRLCMLECLCDKILKLTFVLYNVLVIPEMS